MSRPKKIQFNVNEREYQKLKEYADSVDLSMAEVLRDYIKSLHTEGGCNTSHS
jgi:aerobic-type carbon monoxide dehydrogenase small subunit (CoxS/CutS family)